jgi:cyclase
MRWREQIAATGSAPRFIINTEAHTDHVYGNSYFPSATVVTQEGMAPRYASGIEKMHSPARVDELRRDDPDSVWLVDHPDYPPNHPSTTFVERLLLEVGDHTFECLHLPGHTAEQTAIFVKEEGVVFTGDNVFSGCKTWMQEGDPWAWLSSLERIGELDFVTLVPGHGEARDHTYLARQAEVVSNWLGVVEGFVARVSPKRRQLHNRSTSAPRLTHIQSVRATTQLTNGSRRRTFAISTDGSPTAHETL